MLPSFEQQPALFAQDLDGPQQLSPFPIEFAQPILIFVDVVHEAKLLRNHI